MKYILAAAAASADIFAVVMGLRAFKIKLPPFSGVIISFIGAFFLWLSAAVSAAAGAFLPTGPLMLIARAVLFIMGIHAVLNDHFKNKGQTLTYSKALSDPTSADADHSKGISLREAFSLGLALSADSIFTGISAGIAGLEPNRIFVLSLGFGLIAVPLGLAAGSLLSRFTKKLLPTERLGGIILILLAILL